MTKSTRKTVKGAVFLIILGCLLTWTSESFCQSYTTETKKTKNFSATLKSKSQDSLKSGIKPDRLLPTKNVTVSEIKGRILDYETQKPLSGVTVTVRDKDWKAQSNEDGVYSLPEIPVGYYVLSFKLEGYYSDTRTDVIVRSGRTTFLDIEMLMIRKKQHISSVNTT